MKDIRNFFSLGQDKLRERSRTHSTIKRAELKSEQKGGMSMETVSNSQVPWRPLLSGTNTISESNLEDQWSLVKGAKKSAKHAAIIAQTSQAELYKQSFDLLTQSPIRANANRFMELRSLDDQSSVECNSIDDTEVLQIAKDDMVECKENTQDQSASVGDATSIKEQNQGQQSQIGQNPDSDIMKDNNNPQVIDVQLVMRMFSDIKTELSEIKGKNVSLETVSATIGDNQNTLNVEMVELRNEVSSVKKHNAILTSVVNRLGNLCGDLQRKVDQMEMRSMRRSVVVSGIKTEDKITMCQTAVEKYLEQKLNLSEEHIQIIDCFKLGQGPFKPVVITVQSVQQKSKLFQENATYNKGIKTEENKIYFNDYVPPEVKEERRREKEIYKQNEANQTTKSAMTLGRKGLFIQDEPFERKVISPAPTKILSSTQDEMDRIFSTDMPSGNWFHFENNAFIAHKLIATTHEEINRAYMKMRILYPQASHIICAYRLAGLPKYHQESFCDDGDHGCGRFLLNVLQWSNASCVAVFVVRLYNQHRIGSKRYDLMRKAVKSVFQKHPFNMIMNCNQQIIDSEEDSKSQTLQKKTSKTTPLDVPNRCGRRGGRGASYGRGGMIPVENHKKR